MTGLVLVGFTVSPYVRADDHPPPQANSVSLTGTMPAPAPKTTAVILSPVDQHHFIATPITVSGTCPTGTLVEVYKNNIFAGSTPCESNGKFSLEIDLLFGQNSISARVYDVLNQAGPVSKSVTVYYDFSLAQASPSSFLDFSGAQLLLNTDAAYRGSFPDQSLNVPITVIGGTAPFAINVNWGDSSNEVVPRSDNSTFNTSHAYKKPGTYKIALQGSDSKKLVAYLSVSAIINGTPVTFATTTTPKSATKLLVLWPLFAMVATLVTSFWLGERREKHILGDTNKPQTPPFGIAPQTS
jgi:hypothetical protein